MRRYTAARREINRIQNRIDKLAATHEGLLARRVPFRYITLHYIALYYITLHYITLHCIALHYDAVPSHDTQHQFKFDRCAMMTCCCARFGNVCHTYGRGSHERAPSRESSVHARSGSLWFSLPAVSSSRARSSPTSSRCDLVMTHCDPLRYTMTHTVIHHDALSERARVRPHDGTL